jgi:heat shock protein HslJ
MFGAYEVDGPRLTLKPGGMTMMYCSEELMEQERAFIAALEATSSYIIEGDVLHLRDGDRALARFESHGPRSAG